MRSTIASRTTAPRNDTSSDIGSNALEVIGAPPISGWNKNAGNPSDYAVEDQKNYQTYCIHPWLYDD